MSSARWIRMGAAAITVVAVIVSLTILTIGRARTGVVGDDIGPGTYEYALGSDVQARVNYVDVNEWSKETRIEGEVVQWEAVINEVHYSADYEAREVLYFPISDVGGEVSPEPKFLNRIYLQNLANDDLPVSDRVTAVGQVSAGPGYVPVPQVLEVDQGGEGESERYELGSYSRTLASRPADELERIRAVGFHFAAVNSGPAPPEIEAAEDGEGIEQDSLE